LNSLLSRAETYPGIFSREALAARKEAQRWTKDSIKTFVADAWQPGANGFAQLRKLHDIEKAEYEAKAGKIRHHVFAHAIAGSRNEEAARFANLMVRDLERLVLTPYRMHHALWQLFHNGYEPVLPEMPSKIGDVLAARVGPRVTSWEHVHVVGEVAAFIESLLTRQPPADT
jgi:hypothetical protein